MCVCMGLGWDNVYPSPLHHPTLHPTPTRTHPDSMANIRRLSILTQTLVHSTRVFLSDLDNEDLFGPVASHLQGPPPPPTHTHTHTHLLVLGVADGVCVCEYASACVRACVCV